MAGMKRQDEMSRGMERRSTAWLGRLDPALIRKEIETLRLHYPEIFEDEDLLRDSLEGQTGLHEFLAIVEEQRQEAESMCQAIDQRIKDLADRKNRYQRRELAMRRLAFSLMLAAEQKKLELPMATLSIRNGTPKVLVINEDALEDRYCRHTRTPDKTAIKEALQAGEIVTGATLSNAEPTLAIRTR